jgi:phosphoesterase RecJ-like protein
MLLSTLDFRLSTSFALFTHRNPDGDAIGSILALGTWLENQGKTVSYHIATPIPKTFDFLEKTKIIQSSFDYEKKDCIVFLDSANPVVMFEHLRIGHEEYFEQANTLCIDHHVSNTGYARENIIHPEIGSTCELLASLLETWQP